MAMDDMFPPVREQVLEVEGARIRCEVLPDASPEPGQRLGSGEDPDAAVPILFVHGGGANSSWWRPVLSALRSEGRWRGTAAMIDLSGHGGSDWRDEYSFETWIRELVTAARLLFDGRCALVGHSLGGALVCAAAARGLVDAPVTVSLDGNPCGPVVPARPGQERRMGGVRHVTTAAEAMATLVRHKTGWARGIADEVARRSVVHEPAGWRMQRDPAVFRVAVAPLDPQDLRRTVVVLGGDSPYFARDHATLGAEAGRPGTSLRLQVLSGLGHELMMEDPSRVAEVLAVVLAGTVDDPTPRQPAGLNGRTGLGAVVFSPAGPLRKESI